MGIAPESFHANVPRRSPGVPSAPLWLSVLALWAGLYVTSAEIRARLDAFGPPRHLEPRREVSLNECRRFLLADGGFPGRLESVARVTKVNYMTVQRVVRAFLRETP